MSFLKKGIIIIAVVIGIALLTITSINFPLLIKFSFLVLAIFCCLYLALRFSDDFTEGGEEIQKPQLPQTPKMISPKDYKQKRVKGGNITVVKSKK